MDVNAIKTRQPIIELKHLSKSFGDQILYDDVNLEVLPGETLVVMGGSGSGKSTLLRVLMGHLPYDGGSVRIHGREFADYSRRELNAWRLMVGVLFQTGALFNSMSLRDNLALPVREHTDLPEELIQIMIKIYLQLVGLRESIDRMPSELSGGMKKRAGLARALMMQPRMLFYDEPTAGLDPVSSAQISRLILDLKDKMDVTSIVITHDMNTAFRVADRMALLAEKRFYLVGTPDEFKRSDDPLVRQFVDGLLDGPLSPQADQQAYEADLLQKKVLFNR